MNLRFLIFTGRRKNQAVISVARNIQRLFLLLNMWDTLITKSRSVIDFFVECHSNETRFFFSFVFSTNYSSFN